MFIIHNKATNERDRTAEFAEFVQRRQEQLAVPPLLLSKEQRRLYVRETLREDHRFRIRNRPEGAQAKFNKLSKSFFSFFRGTALLYYRDYAGDDLHLPHVLTIGDVHPENYGVMPNADGAPFFGLNDFDEAYVAPFTYDLKRGAVGFYVAAKVNGFTKKVRRATVCRFVAGYIDGLCEFAQDDREKSHEWRIDNSPDLIRNLLANTQKPRAQFLAKWVDLKRARFVSSAKIVPHSRHLLKFQQIIDTYCAENEIDREHRAPDFFRVKDVAIKKGSGTASLGLDRYFVLIDGPSPAADDDLILELKQARHSALRGLVPTDEEAPKGKAERIVRSHEIHLVGGDVFFGKVMIDDQSFLVRERSPYKDEIAIADLDEDELSEYAHLCGKILAQTHARSDEDTGIMEGNAEKAILAAINHKAFATDIARFAHAAAKQLKRDYKAFKQDHKLGIFQFVD